MHHSETDYDLIGQTNNPTNALTRASGSPLATTDQGVRGGGSGNGASPALFCDIDEMGSHEKARSGDRASFI